ncbi:MAG: Rpn family recombination-promoting nuclease/putative transposase [Treponema sp.]
MEEDKTTTKNREYKNTVFIDLFTSWASPVELYNAISSSNMPEDTKVKPLQISNALYTSLRCDLAFMLENELIVIIEHQSTINENMPTRLLLYIALLYLNILDEEIKYARTLKPIPTPRFFVLYNGKENLPEISELRLSDAFMLKDEKSPIQLELIVPVININYGQNKEIMKKCKTLHEYSYLVDRIRKYEAIDKEKKFDLAIKDCIEHGMLDKYLTEQWKRVRNMLQSEYNYNLDIAVQRAEAREAGILLGIEKGMQKGIQKGIQRGIQKGKMEGISETAKKLIAMNLSIEQIAQATGLSIEEISKL